jgi:hypothetical protein
MFDLRVDVHIHAVWYRHVTLAGIVDDLAASTEALLNR